MSRVRCWPISRSSANARYISSSMYPYTADETGQRIAFGRMTNQARRFVDYQQIGVFMNDVEQFFHPSRPPEHRRCVGFGRFAEQFLQRAKRVQREEEEFRNENRFAFWV